MIKINLLGDDTAIDHSGTWLFLGYVLSLAVLVVVFVLMYVSTSSQIEDFETERASLQRQLDTLKVKTKEVRDLDTKRKELGEKTAVITLLKQNKMGPVHVLDDLNIAIPERAWITQAKETNGILRISGVAIDNQTIAVFMRELENSDYFVKVDLEEAKTAKRTNVAVKEFTLIAQIAYAGKKVQAAVSAAQAAAEEARKAKEKDDKARKAAAAAAVPKKKSEE